MCETGYLDTLPLTVELSGNSQCDKLIKRGIRKAISHAQAKKLLELDTPLSKQYERTMFCGSSLKVMSDGSVKSWFCGKRWCPVCSANKQGEMINGYQEAVNSMEEPYMVTLTVPAVKFSELSEAIKGLPHAFRLIKDTLRKQGIKLRGIRKIECNYNPKKETYNPHYHMLVDGEIEARALYHYWLRYHPEAVPEAQDIKKAQEGTLKELVKYTTKTIVGKKFYPHATDNINKALRGVRTFQAYGGIRKAQEAPQSPEQPSPDTTPTPEEMSPHREAETVLQNYYWWGDGWYNSEGIALVHIEYTPNMKRLLKNIRGAPLGYQLE